jgi:hypothetical protein
VSDRKDRARARVAVAEAVRGLETLECVAQRSDHVVPAEARAARHGEVALADEALELHTRARLLACYLNTTLLSGCCAYSRLFHGHMHAEIHFVTIS